MSKEIKELVEKTKRTVKRKRAIERLNSLAQEKNANWLGKTNIEALEIALDYIQELEIIKGKKVEGYLHNNIWICRDIADNYIHKPEVRKIIDNHYPDVAIVRLNELLEERK